LANPEATSNSPSSVPSEKLVYKTVTNGSCFDVGYYPIFDKDLCRDAASSIGFGEVGVVQVVDYNDWINGCTAYVYNLRHVAFVNTFCDEIGFPQFCNNCEPNFPRASV